MAIAATYPLARSAWHPLVVEDPSEWNEVIASSPVGHVLQSAEWGDCKRQFGWSAERIALLDPAGRVCQAAQVLWRTSPLGPVAYIPRGPVAFSVSPTAESEFWNFVHERLRRRRAVFVRVEPNQASAPGLRDAGFRPAGAVVQADATIHIDLRPELEEILNGFKPKTRYNIRLAQRRGVQVSQGTYLDLPAFYTLLEQTSRRDGFYIRPYSYYENVFATLGEKARLLLAHHDGDLLASALVTVFGSEAIYLYGASSNEKRNLMPAYLLQWEGMKLAKALGCERYDFWGIPAQVDPATGAPIVDASLSELGTTGNGLWGVYRFKAGFGGRIVTYDGAWDYVYSGWRYRLWTRLMPAVRGYWSRKGH